MLEHRVINRTVVTIDPSSSCYSIQILIQSHLDGIEIQRAPKMARIKSAAQCLDISRERTNTEFTHQLAHPSGVRATILYSFRRKGGIRQFIPQRSITAWHVISTHADARSHQS